MKSRLFSICSALLAVVLLLTIFSPAVAYASSSDSSFSPSMLSEEYRTRYIPFVFTNFEDFEPGFLDDSVKYEPGYLYLKDVEANTTYLLVAEIVTDTGCTGSKVYYISEKKYIGCVDIIDFSNSVVCSFDISNSNNLWRLLVSDEIIYFAESDNIYTTSLDGKDTIYITTLKNVCTFYPLDKNHIAWVDSENANRVLDLSTGENTAYDTYEAMFGDMFDLSETDPEYESIMALGNTSVSLPLSSYPIGSYYSENGSQCACHSSTSNPCSWNVTCNCKLYRGGIQCLAFAKYAFDVYSHCENYSVWGDYCSSSTHCKVDAYAPNPLTATNTRLTSYKVGTYLRVGSNPSVSSTHSVIICENNGSYISVYECNVSAPCKVGVRRFSYAQFRAVYYLYDVFQHNWATGSVYYNSTYHKVSCTISGCPGYILVQHPAGCTECVHQAGI